MPNPSVRVVEGEADDQDERQARLPGGGGLADREALGEVVQADAGRDQQREPARADSDRGSTTARTPLPSCARPEQAFARSRAIQRS